MGKALPLVKPQRQQQMERIQRLPRAQQRFVMQVIDTALAQQDR
jgi:hypothetical protein